MFCSKYVSWERLVRVVRYVSGWRRGKNKQEIDGVAANMCLLRRSVRDNKFPSTLTEFCWSFVLCFQ